MKFKPKYLVLLFLSFIVLPFLLLITYNNRDSIVTFIRPSAGVTNRFFSKPFHFVSDIVTDSRALFSTFEENQVLKSELSNYQTLLSENNSLKSENASLRESAKLIDQYQDKTYMTAEVISRLSPSWTSKIVVSKGEQDGVVEKMLVLANNGVVGIVASVDDNSSTVQLLSDDFSKPSLPVTFEGVNSVYGILSEYDAKNHVFKVSQLNQNSGVEIGQTVVTSDLSESYAPNIAIGKVVKVLKDDDELGLEVFVEPSADFSRIYSVVLVGQDL
ncbi:rod shape-determining protein MreC [Streptococcus moroccensis]|uniref:Cell shape-determining protein MreC n=1 Tax=Streptococcus moroccensis TaxID=1451356 RepID=A0ABT9YQU9_9STRE|nr:rod shape-determining protein MreC [Streptococcus moroccensis]MDQ0222109.1 rod shape-determining protein MreC [Streptococcus moroccensis]